MYHNIYYIKYISTNQKHKPILLVQQSMLLSIFEEINNCKICGMGSILKDELLKIMFMIRQHLPPTTSLCGRLTCSLWDPGTTLTKIITAWGNHDQVNDSAKCWHLRIWFQVVIITSSSHWSGQFCYLREDNSSHKKWWWWRWWWWWCNEDAVMM